MNNEQSRVLAILDKWHQKVWVERDAVRMQDLIARIREDIEKVYAEEETKNG